MNTADFMGIKPYTGLNTINNILSLANVKIPIDGPITKYTSRFLIARELNMLFRQLRKEDKSISFEDIEEMPQEEIDNICFKRGININQSPHAMKEDLKLWLTISNQQNVPNSLLLTTRVLDFHGNMFSINDDETPDMVLRRSKDSIFYLETVRIFEEAFGIKELEKGL